MMTPLNLQEQHLQNFWGKWLRKEQQPSENTNAEGEQSMAQRKGQLETEEEWVDSDFEQHEDEAWGMKPRDKQPAAQSDEDMFDSDWDDDSDDESGGQMMPVADW